MCHSQRICVIKSKWWGNLLPRIRMRDNIDCKKNEYCFKIHSYEVLCLENKLDVLKKQEKDLLPEREQIGYNLRLRYETLLETKREIYQQLEVQLRQYNTNRTDKETEEKHNQYNISKFKLEIGMLQERVKAFDEREKDLYQRHQVEEVLRRKGYRYLIKVNYIVFFVVKDGTR